MNQPSLIPYKELFLGSLPLLVQHWRHVLSRDPRETGTGSVGNTPEAACKIAPVHEELLLYFQRPSSLPGEGQGWAR